MSRVRVRTDAEINGPDEELPLPTLEPFGYPVPWLLQKRFVLVSRSRGVLCFFHELEMALPFVRMAVVNTWKPKGPLLDFRLYEWSEEFHGWQVCMNTVELDDLRKVLREAVNQVARGELEEVAI
jgi:hypothetical protein